MFKTAFSLLLYFSWFLPSVLSSGTAHGQTPALKAGTDTLALNMMVKKSQRIMDADSAISLLETVVQKSIEANYFNGAADAFLNLASKFEYSKADYPEALNCCEKCILYATKAGNRIQVSKCHNGFGAIYASKGNYVMASQEYLKGIDELKKNNAGYTGDAVMLYNNLANIYEKLGQYDKLLYYLDQAETVINSGALCEQPTYFNKSYLYLNRAAYFVDFHQPDSAIKYYELILDVAGNLKNAVFKNELQLQAKASLGDMYVTKGDFKKAVSCLEPIVLNTENKHSYFSSIASNALGRAWFHLKKYKKAEDVILSALKETSGAYANADAIYGYKILADVYKATKQYKKALDCMDSILVLKDTLISAEKINTVNQAEARYNIAEKDRQITKNELLIAQQKNKITQKNIWIGSISAGVFMLTLLSFGLYRNRSLKQDGIIKSLQQQNTINILKGVVQGEENERIRLARDLHDGIGGMLSATKMRFMALRHDNEDLVHSPRYLEAMGLLDIMGDEIRKTSHNLMPEVLLKQNLADALRTYCNNIQAGTDLQLDFQSFGNFDKLPNDFKLNIYRIVQELLKNVLQHARATYVVVQLMMLEAYLTISVEDNGSGFNTNETKDGIGLHNLKTRVLSHEGHYTLKSEAGKGTTVYIEFGMPAAG